MDSVISDIVALICSHEKLLIIDKRFGSANIIEKLTTELCLLKFKVTSISHDEALCIGSNQSVIGLMQKKPEVLLVNLESTTNKIKISPKRKNVFYIQTMNQKIPFAKKLFDHIHIIKDKDNVNNSTKMVHDLLKMYTCCQDDCIDFIYNLSHNSLVIVMLVLYQNLLTTKIPQSELCELMGNLMKQDYVTSAFKFEENVATLVVSCVSLLSALTIYKPKQLDYTQHISMYSLISNNKKKAIEQAYSAQED